MNTNIAELVKEAYQTACDKGWHDKPREFGTCVALIHDEVNEAAEVLDSIPASGAVPEQIEKIAGELADVIVRIFDGSGEFQIPLGESFAQKTGGLPLEYMFPKEVKFGAEINTSLLDTFLLKLHRKVSNSIRVFRDSNDEGKDKRIADTFTDVILHTAVISHSFDIPTLEYVFKNMEKNKLRPHKHGGKKI